MNGENTEAGAPRPEAKSPDGETHPPGAGVRRSLRRWAGRARTAARTAARTLLWRLRLLDAVGPTISRYGEHCLVQAPGEAEESAVFSAGWCADEGAILFGAAETPAERLRRGGSFEVVARFASRANRKRIPMRRDRDGVALPAWYIELLEEMGGAEEVAELLPRIRDEVGMIHDNARFDEAGLPWNVRYAIWITRLGLSGFREVPRVLCFRGRPQAARKLHRALRGEMLPERAERDLRRGRAREFSLG